MDSGSSGGTQSSSGGEEDYNSLADSSISAFFNPNNPPPPHRHSSSSSSSMFDPVLNFFDPLSRSAPPPLPPPFTSPHLDVVWSKTVRSEPDLGGFTASSSSPTVSLVTHQSQSRVDFPSNSQMPHRLDNNTSKATAPNNDHSGVVRNPRKRSRASRRAPTTVLKTDTTNFRAMVQEFTGIPEPPFTSSFLPRANRLDLFGTSSSSPPPPPPPYLLRPFAQKLQPLHPSFLSPSSSSMADHAIVAATELTNHNIIATSTLYQSLLNQGPLRYNPLSDSAVLGTKQQECLQINPSNDDSHLKMGVLGEFSLTSSNSHHHGLQNVVSSSSEAGLTRREIDNGDTAKLGTGDGGGSSEGYHHHHQQHQGLLRSVNGSPQRVVNYNGSLGFNGDKGTDQNVVTRSSEGMVESWICSSD